MSERVVDEVLIETDGEPVVLLSDVEEAAVRYAVPVAAEYLRYVNRHDDCMIGSAANGARHAADALDEIHRADVPSWDRYERVAAGLAALGLSLLALCPISTEPGELVAQLRVARKKNDERG